MTTLLIRLAGPMQSWGGESKFDRRFTQRTPSKSAVIGLVASALGRRRWESTDDLASLRFGSRVDRAGTVLRDFQTTTEGPKTTHVIEKYYLADAVFLVGLEGDEALLREIDNALARPFFPLFLGRRSCPAEGRVSLGLRNCRLEEALELEPWLAANKEIDERISLRISIETQDEEKRAYFLRDMPVSFDPQHRQFGFRRTSEYMARCATVGETAAGGIPTAHDPMGELEV